MKEHNLWVLKGHDEWHASPQQDVELYFLSLDPEYSRLRDEGILLLQCCRMREMLRVGRASAMISDHGLHATTPFLSLTNISFIDVWHGIPFKGFTPDDFRAERRYRETCVSYPAMNLVYEDLNGFEPERVVELGYAGADKLLRKGHSNKDLRQSLSIENSSKLVPYAPTWQQDDRGRELFPFGTSQDVFIDCINSVYTAHSATLEIRSQLNASIGQREFPNVRYCSMKDFPDAEDVLLQADVLICDWSSIALDFLALQRPTIFPDVEHPFSNGFSLGPEYSYGDICPNMDSLLGSLENTLSRQAAFLNARADSYREAT